MFLTRMDFEDSLNVIREPGELDADFKMKMAEGFAKEMFDNFDTMSEGDKKAILEMIISDMKVDYVMN